MWCLINGMTARQLLTIITLMTSHCALAGAQELAVRYFPERIASVVGEPVFVIAEYSNIAGHTVRFDESCLESFKPAFPVKARRTTKFYGCAPGGTGGSCSSRRVELKPDEKLSVRSLLPDGIEPNSPGDFQYEAQRDIRFYATDGSDSEVGRQEVNEAFTVRVVEENENQLRADYGALVADLQSPDLGRSSMALMALIEHPRDFLEPVILEMSENPRTMSMSVEGLKKLGTDAAKHRLAELTDSQYDDESVRQTAATALAELGDRNYCGVMLQLLNLRQGYASQVAVGGAGLLCGDTAIPQLVSLLSASPVRAFEITYALGNTATPNALPPLIELLKNSDADVRRAARDALYTLTHRQSSLRSVPEEYREWTAWWASQGRTARIFSPAECP
jgi:HEAT repeat protein